MDVDQADILLVDDDAAAARVLARRLEAEGFAVAWAGDGYEALCLLRRGFRPALILLELAMPRLDGWVFRERQLRDPSLSPIPVILLSAETNLSQHAASLRADGCFLKPVEPEVLLEAIRLLALPAVVGLPG
jgi:CheY-like chemotaxis protein